MKFFSPSQIEVYESANDFILKRLDQILDRSKSPASQDALFFTLNLMLTMKTDVIREVINILYKNDLIKTFLLDLTKWINAENNDSKFIKSITDSRFIPTDKQNSQYITTLELEFAERITENTRLFVLEKAPKAFETKYLMLCQKYDAIIKPDSVADTALTT